MQFLFISLRKYILFFWFSLIFVLACSDEMDDQEIIDMEPKVPCHVSEVVANWERDTFNFEYTFQFPDIYHLEKKVTNDPSDGRTALKFGQGTVMMTGFCTSDFRCDSEPYLEGVELNFPLPDSLNVPFSDDVIRKMKYFVCSDRDTILALYYSKPDSLSYMLAEGELYFLTGNNNTMRYGGYLSLGISDGEEVFRMLRTFKRY